ncbi:UNC-like C-terminal-domain-containing protein [Apiospora hydei]|uniref:UNC-like C-terminal-domain-containing protein n=1 Tax=Apiospora hydei TaxID=1337664 RepID=A0ABR1UPZ4_9PEZI
MRQSIEERTPTPEPDNTRRAMSEPHIISQERLHPIRATTMIAPSSSNNRNKDEDRPPNKRTVSDSAGLEYYQPPTPASLQDNGEEVEDVGYDSEPNMPRNRRPDRDRGDAEQARDMNGDGNRDYFSPSHSHSRRNSGSSQHHHHHHHQRPSSSSSSLANEEATTTEPHIASSSSSATPTTATVSTNATSTTTSPQPGENGEDSVGRHNDGLPPHHHALSICNGGHNNIPTHEDVQNGVEPMIEGGYNSIATNNTMAEPSHRAARPPITHTGSLRKPLPSLPENPDPDMDSDTDHSIGSNLDQE